MRLWLIVVALLLLAPQAMAQSGASLGAATYGGNGCPGGTARARLSSDGSTLALTFTRYQVAAGGSAGRSFDRRTCNFSIPISVPAGMSAAIAATTFRGNNQLPAGATSVLRVEHFITGGRGPVFERTFTGPRQANFSATQASALVWTSCGADAILRTNSSLRVTTTASRAARARIDSAVAGAIVFTLQWRRC